MFWKQVFAKWHVEDSSGQTALNQMSRFGKAKDFICSYFLLSISNFLTGIISLTLKLLHCHITQHHSKYFVIFLSDSYELMAKQPKAVHSNLVIN